MIRRGRLPTTEPAPHLHETADASDTDQAEIERGPLRRCIVTRTQGERARMIRFVLAPDRQVVPDLAANLPGRGMWLSARADVVETARIKGSFARAARGPVSAPVTLLAQVQDGLTRRVIERLGMARRAGQAVAGFARVREWLAQERAGGVIQATDGSEAERARLLGSARANVWVGWPLNAAQLGGVFGREAAVHVAVAHGRLADSLLIEIERLSGVSGQALLRD